MRFLLRLKKKIQRKINRTFCPHDWIFDEVVNTRQSWPRNAAFLYTCDKCGSHKTINCDDIEKKIKQYGQKDCFDYVEDTVLLANGYGPALVEYAGRDVGRAIQWYWDHEGVLISAYSHKNDRVGWRIQKM